MIKYEQDPKDTFNEALPKTVVTDLGFEMTAGTFEGAQIE